MIKPKLSQTVENLSTLFCMLALVVVAFSAQLSANRNSLTISVFTMVFVWSLLGLKTEPSVRYQMSIPLSEPLNASNSITENMILKRVGPRTHSCLTLCLGQINISRVEVSVLFLTPCQQSHVPYGSRINSLVRVHVQDGC